ncbi:MAG: hybrid sensor histidine kinase/response regulator [Nitrospinae bacterium]|nr:hybrid sensor histidine kinase/response regulator [Nitrospinota bacterium]
MFTILAVDDNPNNLYTLKTILSEVKNITILEGLSGKDALSMALSSEINLILLDIQMPELDGFEVARLLKMRQRTKNIPIIFLTAVFKSEEFIEKGYQVGAVDYLTKPIDDNQLINKIRMHQNLYQKQNELIELNASLEEKVALRTSELKKLNRDLEKRVAEEVEKSRQKDKVISKQFRHIEMAELLVNIAHQWRQPICAIGATVQEINDAYQHNELNEDYLNDLVEEVMNEVVGLSKTIKQFNTFFAKEPKIVKFNIKETIQKALSWLENEINKRNIKVNLEVDGKYQISGYPNEFSQAVYNILNNAVEICRERKIEKGQINIQAKENLKTNMVRIEITDNCGGIAKEVLDKIFNPYYTTGNRERGKGIGLFMSKTIIETNMHGSLLVENTANGAKFIIEVKI